MATMLLPNRTHLRVQAAFSSAGRPGTLRSVLPGASRQQQQQHRHRIGLPQQQQQQQLVARPIGPAGLLLPGTALSPVNARQTTIMRSFLGVGAPEAILVAVVALVVFGPKGLADAAKSLGQTLRAFQPTIKEVVEVSQEIKGTLEQELGLDELRNAASMRPTPRPIQPDTSTSSSSTATSSSSDAPAAGSEASTSGSSSSSSGTNPPTLRAISEDMAVQLDPDIELKRAMSEQAAWGGQAPVASAGTAAAAAAAAAGSSGEGKGAAGKDLSTLSLEELEAELERRRKAASP